jgi:hydrogenase maturation protease
MSRAAPRILVVGIGNPDRGDDGAGIMVADGLAGRLPPGVTLVVRSGDILGLVQDWAGYDALVCVDAAALMERPGQVHRFDATGGRLPPDAALTSSHAFGLAEALALARELQLLPATVTVYAIEGACFDAGTPMTPEVTAAVVQVVALIVDEVAALGQHPN